MNDLKWHKRCVALIAVVGAIVTTACAQSRTVTVTATVRNGSGAAVAQIPVGLVGGSVAIVRTNEAGQAVITSEVPTTRTKLLVALSPWLRGEAYIELESDIAKYKSVTSASAFKPVYEVTLDPQQNSYSIELTGQPVVKVSGRIVASAEVLKAVSVGAKWSIIDAEPSLATGEFEVAIAKDVDSDLFVENGVGGEVHAVRITAAQAAADVAIGDIVVSDSQVGRKVEIQIANNRTLQMTSELPKDGTEVACLISSDGSRIFIAGIGRDGRVCLRDDDVSPLQLPPGTYYAATGGTAEFGYGIDLWRFLKAGREADVQAAQVPKLVVPNDAATSVIQWSFDASQAAAAIRSIQ